MKDEIEGLSGGELSEESHAPKGKSEKEPESKGKDPEERGITAKEAAALRKEISELRESERHWANQAKGRRVEVEEVESDDEPEETDPFANETAEELIAAISKDGKNALKKRGFVTAADVRQLAREEAENAARKHVSQAEGRLNRDAELVSEYPGLKDQSSPLFKRTAMVFQDMVGQDASLKHSPGALKAAARVAKTELEAEEKAKQRRPAAEEDDDADDAERSRRTKVRAQQGERGGNAFELDDETPEVGAQTRQIMDAMKIKPDSRKKVIEAINKGRRAV